MTAARGEGFVVSIGEALIDMLQTQRGDELVYVPAPGGSPLNVAVGLARLGVPCQFVSAFGSDPLGRWLEDFLRDEGVGLDGSASTPLPTTIALTSFDGATPHFVFYGTPKSYGAFEPGPDVERLLADAAVVHAGSIGLIEPTLYALARAAFDRPGVVATVDPNVREMLIDDLDAYRARIEELFARAALVKLSIVDAGTLYPGLDADAVLDRIAATGARAVVVTLGAGGLVALRDGRRTRVPARDIVAVDETGAGDACMAGLVRALVLHGESMSDETWEASLETAVGIAGHVCERPGGAAAMPRPDDVLIAG